MGACVTLTEIAFFDGQYSPPLRHWVSGVGSVIATAAAAATAAGGGGSEFRFK